MIEYLVGAAIIGTAAAVIDQQNLIPQLSNNPQKKWIWDQSRWTVTPPTQRFNQFNQFRPMPVSGERRIELAQEMLGNLKREIWTGVQEQQQMQANQGQNGLSKYQICR